MVQSAESRFLPVKARRLSTALEISKHGDSPGNPLEGPARVISFDYTLIWMHFLNVLFHWHGLSKQDPLLAHYRLPRWHSRMHRRLGLRSDRVVFQGFHKWFAFIQTPKQIEKYIPTYENV